jgi:hypothetical protein
LPDIATTVMLPELLLELDLERKARARARQYSDKSRTVLLSNVPIRDPASMPLVNEWAGRAYRCVDGPAAQFEEKIDSLRIGGTSDEWAFRFWLAAALIQ